MIRSVVFDFGQVLVRFDPAYIVSLSVTDPDDARLLVDVLFDRIYWDRMDRGTITDEEFLSSARDRLPSRLHDVAAEIYWSWVERLPAIDGMWELVRYLKATYPIRLFLLSNISTYFAANAHRFPILAELDDCVFSAECKMAKPDASIFRYLCERCDLVADETLFIDDSPANIQGAAACGIHGYLFDGDASALRAYLDDLFSQA